MDFQHALTLCINTHLKVDYKSVTNFSNDKVSFKTTNTIQSQHENKHSKHFLSQFCCFFLYKLNTQHIFNTGP